MRHERQLLERCWQLPETANITQAEAMFQRAMDAIRDQQPAIGDALLEELGVTFLG